MRKKAQALMALAASSGALRQSAILTAGNTVTGVIMATAMIAASKILGPEKFGLFSVSVAIMSVFSKGTDLGLSAVISRMLNQWHNDEKTFASILGQIQSWKRKMFLVTLLVGLASIPLLQRELNFPHTTLLIWAIIGAVIMGLYEHVSLVLSAQHKFSQVSTLGVSQAGWKAVGFLVALVFFTNKLEALSIAYYLAPLCALIVYGHSQRKSLFLTASAQTGVKKEMIQYASHAAVGTVAMVLIANIDVLFVQRYLNSFDTGIYAGASRIAAFISFAVVAVGSVLNNRVARYKQKKTLILYLKKSLSIVALSVLGFLCFLPLAKMSIILTIGPEYLPGLNALIILVLNAFLGLAITPSISYFYSVQYPWFFSLGGIIQLAIIFAGNWIFVRTFGIDAAAWTRLIATLAFCFFTLTCLFISLRSLPDE